MTTAEMAATEAQRRGELVMTPADRAALDSAIAAMRDAGKTTDEESPVGAMLARRALIWEAEFEDTYVVAEIENA